MSEHFDLNKDLKENVIAIEKVEKLLTDARIKKLNNIVENRKDDKNLSKDYWCKELSYHKSEDKNVGNIRNFLRYKILVHLGADIDCDKDPEIFKMYKKLFRGGEFEKDRYFKIWDMTLESDTMTSFITLFNIYLRMKFNGDLLGQYQEYFGKEVKSELARELWSYFNISKWYEKWDEKDKAIIGEFNKFAKSTHTLANMSLISKGLNSSRSEHGKYDFWDLTLMKIREYYLESDSVKAGEKLLELSHNEDKIIDDCIKWLDFGNENNKKQVWEDFVEQNCFKCYLENNEVKPFFNGRNWKKPQITEKNLTADAIKNIWQSIEDRGKELEAKLNNK